MSSSEEKISIDDRLLRRVQFLHPSFIKEDGTPASSSFTLKKGENGLSVDVERLTDYDKSIQDSSRFRLYALKASYTQELGLDNVLDPIEGNSAHALIKGNFNRSISRKLAANCEKILYP
ncbi:hypothetical protein SAMN04488029_3003 [Reichenbachiella faecimaris]|uniref:Uncharacterized protein n=1 Tax=Reichenbachiella faecimaris TaxID=692418 RepID=A0A1W2GJ85_REIFA|nr:hypothetical protein [Reichenbachiella faecimaris]SMD36641.1 hypothetical protein SAMN04488029_3003 [Reichenbachiella faecimaris]